MQRRRDINLGQCLLSMYDEHEMIGAHISTVTYMLRGDGSAILVP